MGASLHAGVLTSFTGGELTPQLAGRVDKEEMKIGSRYVSNFIPEHQGGLKKFYGSGHVAQVADNLDIGYCMVPFDGCGEPLCLLFTKNNVYCVTDTQMYTVPIKISLQMMMGASYVQSSDVLYITNENMGQAVITYSGRNPTTGRHTFSSDRQTFVTEPFFPLNWQGNYNGGKLHTTASTGSITISAPSTPTIYAIELPNVLKNCGAGKNITDETDSTLAISDTRANHAANAVIGECSIELHRIRGQNDEVVSTVGATIGSVQTSTKSRTITSGQTVIGYITYSVKYRMVTDQMIASAFDNLILGTGYIENGYLKFTHLPVIYQTGDMFYIKITQGDSYNSWSGTHDRDSVNGYIGVHSIEGYTEETEPAALIVSPGMTFGSKDVVGRKLKFSMERQDNGVGVKSWSEGIEVNVNDIVYSDGHYYQCMAIGNDHKTGQTQPTHTSGIFSDGKVSWLYLHSGYGYVTITSVESTTSMTGYVDSLLPYTSGISSDAHDWSNYQWSMWGYNGKYPNNVFMFNGRLGYTLDTGGYGSWLQLSKADEFDDFSVEDFGEITDICAINTLISEYNENRINWIISGYRLYMGSYAGEYNISGGDENKSVITPSNCNILPVSQAGGGPVKATKFEDLNLFASGDRKQLFSLKYDYTTDDYSPNDIGFAGEDLLTAGISSMWHLRGYDRNLYLRTDDNKIVLINQPEDVKALGFFRINMKGDVLSHCVSNANGQSVQFLLVKRGDVYTVEFVESNYLPYMLNTKRYVPAEGETQVASTITDTIFANQTVYVYNNTTHEFQKEIVGSDGVINNPFETDSIDVGIEMPCEVHTHPLYNDKFETTQQKSVRYTIRVVDSGAFSYGSSNDFTKWYDYNNANTAAEQEYGEAHRLMTGDIKLPSSFGYQQAQNKADSKYPNDTATALSIKAVTPEPFNLLLVSSIYV